jgi:hypothetical protein
MSRDVLASARDPDTGPSRWTSTARRAVGRRTGAVVGAALAGVAVITAVVVPLTNGASPPDPRPLPAPTSETKAQRDEDGEPRFPAGQGLTGVIQPMPKAADFVDRVRARIVVHNALPQPRRVFDVVLRGWGVVHVDNLPDGEVTVSAGGSVALPVMIVPDCAEVRTGMVEVLVRQQRGTAQARVERMSLPLDPDPYSMLDRLCPPPVPGASVTAAATVLRPDGVVLARLVNNGEETVRVSDLPDEGADPAASPVRLDTVPPLPVELDLGEALTVRMAPVVRGCASAEGSQVRLVAQAAGRISGIRDAGSTSPGLQELLDEAVRQALARACDD